MSKPTILIVEDNPRTRKLVRIALESKGYVVLEAANAAHALELASFEHPDLILQDMMLGDMDGFELAKKLRTLTGTEISIIAFSGFISKIDDTRLAENFDDVIIKPVEPSFLLRVVENHLKHNLTKESFAKGRRVVVADDNPSQLKLVRFHLTRLGFEVETARDGQEALHLAKTLQPDAIIADVLMPKLDGFELAMSVRQDPQLAQTPLLLITSSYIEDRDKELARQSGANDLILRTPDLREVITGIKGVLAGEHPLLPGNRYMTSDLEVQHTERIAKQLERQAQLNYRLAQRCAALTAQLRVLTGVSEAVLKHHDLISALEEVLSVSFDAGGITVGALYLREENNTFQTLPLPGALAHLGNDKINSFFDHIEVLSQFMSQRASVNLPSETIDNNISEDILKQCNATSAMLLPLVQGNDELGILFLVADESVMHDESWQAFVQGLTNQVTLAVALARTFAKKEQAEKIAQDHEALLHLMLESMTDGVVAADLDFNVLLWNDAAEKISRSRSNKIEAGHCEKQVGVYYPDGVTPCAFPDLPIQRSMRGESVDNEQFILRPAHEELDRLVTANARPLVDAHGKRRGAMVVFRDITAEKLAEAQLMTSDRMASIGMLAGGVAHEINNPLAVILGNLELALNEGAVQSNTDLRSELMDASQSGERIRQIVHDLKMFSRHKDEHTNALDLHAVLESTLRLAYNEIRHRACLRKHFSGDVYIEGNEARVGQLFLNLIVNAIQAIPEGHAQSNEISVETYTDAGDVMVAVKDTGSGMPPETLSRLFTPFFSTKPQGVGTGLGLTICKKIVDGMHGQLEIHSDVGKGTTVTVRLPKADAVPATMSDYNPLISSRRLKILIVDDEPMVTNLVTRTLGANHDVQAVTFPTLAIDKINHGERFDIMLCDLMMPHVTGMDLYEAVKKIDAEQAERMVFMTGGAFTPRAQEFIAHTHNMKIAKPFRVQDLEALVARAIAETHS
jgi:CheY-like chemotaxis protein